MIACLVREKTDFYLILLLGSWQKDELVYTAGTIAYCMENKDMLQFLNRCSRGRGAWLLMALTAFLLELTALYFQHIMLLQPCVMCIYERVALFGILGASLLGAIAPRSPLRYLAIAV